MINHHFSHVEQSSAECSIRRRKPVPDDLHDTGSIFWGENVVDLWHAPVSGACVMCIQKYFRLWPI